MSDQRPNTVASSSSALVPSPDADRAVVVAGPQPPPRRRRVPFYVSIPEKYGPNWQERLKELNIARKYDEVDTGEKWKADENDDSEASKKPKREKRNGNPKTARAMCKNDWIRDLVLRAAYPDFNVYWDTKIRGTEAETVWKNAVETFQSTRAGA